MKKRLLSNIVFFLTVSTFILLAFSESKNNNITDLEIIFKQDDYQYISTQEVYDKINLQNKQSIYSIKDINTRLLEDSIETLTYVKNAEVYLSLNNKLTILIQQENPFIRTVINNDIFFFTRDSVKLNVVDGQSPNVLFFIDDINLKPWAETLYLADYLYGSGFLKSIIHKVSYNHKSEYILHSDLFDLKINIGDVNKLSEKVDLIKLYFATIIDDERLKNNKVKVLNVKYEDQVICINEKVVKNK